jgi:ABC-2 type transport system ATP-binding protein
LIDISGRLVPFIELGVGFSPELTGRENVFLNGALLGFSKKEITEQYDEIVDFAELEPFMDQKLKNYSSVMQVRLAFSMAVRAKADVLLIDEVLAVGDADFQRKCFDYFKKLKKDKVTVVLVTHDMEAVREYCDRAMLIEKSKIIDIGSTSDIAEKYLKLFSKNSQQFDNKKSENSNRWGDGSVVSKDISMAVEVDSISINQNITVNNELKGFVAGFRLRDSAGKEITGTNTKIEGVKLPLLISGSQASIVWKFPNILSEVY